MRTKFKEGEILILKKKGFETYGIKKGNLVRVESVFPRSRIPYEVEKVGIKKFRGKIISVKENEAQYAGKLANLLYT